MTQNNVGYTWGERKIMPGIMSISISGTNKINCIVYNRPFLDGIEKYKMLMQGITVFIHVFQ